VDGRIGSGDAFLQYERKFKASEDTFSLKKRRPAQTSAQVSFSCSINNDVVWERYSKT